MNIDNTELLEALKKPRPAEPTDEKKREVADGLYEWQKKKDTVRA